MVLFLFLFSLFCLGFLFSCSVQFFVQLLVFLMFSLFIFDFEFWGCLIFF